MIQPKGIQTRVSTPMYAVAMCFVNYKDEILNGCVAEWIKYACGRWLHLDCAEDCITDQNGKKYCCPYCIV